MVLGVRRAFLRCKDPWILVWSLNLDCPSPPALLAGVNPPGGSLLLRNPATGVHPNLGDIVWFKGREGVVVNSDWLEGEEGADPKISVQFLESDPVDLKLEEVEDVEILSVRERQQSHQSASTSAKPPSGAFAWLVGGDATAATCTRGASDQGGSAPHSREKWPYHQGH